MPSERRPELNDELFLRARSGDNEACELFERAAKRFLFSIALGAGAKRDLLSDITQDVFLEAFSPKTKFKPQGTIKAWLASICLRMTSRRIKKERRWQSHLSLDHSDSEHPDPAETIAINDRISRIREVLRRAIAGLPLNWVYALKNSKEDTIEKFGVSQQACNGWIRNAKRAMYFALLQKMPDLTESERNYIRRRLGTSDDE